jgi:hypothetical protein
LTLIVNDGTLALYSHIRDGIRGELAGGRPEDPRAGPEADGREVAMASVPVRYWNWIIQNFTGETQIGLLAGQVIVGSSDENEITVTATGIGDNTFWSTQSVFLQVQQQWPEANTDFGWNDEFALQVIETDLGLNNGGGDSLTFRVKRLDAAIGWGQELAVNILIAVFLVGLE